MCIYKLKEYKKMPLVVSYSFLSSKLRRQIFWLTFAVIEDATIHLCLFSEAANVITLWGGILASNAITFDGFNGLFSWWNQQAMQRVYGSHKKSQQIGRKGGIPGRFASAVIEEALERSTLTASWSAFQSHVCAWGRQSTARLLISKYAVRVCNYFGRAAFALTKQSNRVQRRKQ